MITSRDNPLVRRARSVRDGKLKGLIFVEGLRLAEEAHTAALSIEDVICTEELVKDERAARLLASLARTSARITLMNESVFYAISDTKTPQGIVLLAVRPQTGLQQLLKAEDRTPLLVIMHRINNPANAGAIIRTAEAAGATGAVTTAGSTDLFSPKALRGSMGSSFRLPLWTDAEYPEILEWCARNSIQTVSADAHAEQTLFEVDWTLPRALILGPEASGLEETEMAATDEALRIPMRAPVESLNVAVACGIVLYEAARQRGEKA